MSDAPAREWRFHIDDMIGFAGKVLAYTGGLDQDRFVANGLHLWSIIVSDVPALIANLRRIKHPPR